MIKVLSKILTKVFGKAFILNFLKSIANLARVLSYYSHKIQFRYEWNTEPLPEWFDHFTDQHYLFRESKNPLWAERGIFNLLAMKQGATVLELCCGDGFNTYHCYSLRSNNIIAVDFDSTAIKHAIKYNQAKNIQFLLRDIRNEMPEGKFDNIIWDAAIEHFTSDEINMIMKSIKNRMNKEGILSGYTIQERQGGKGLVYHEYEFKSKEDLLRFFTPYFNNVKVFETIYPERHNLYFFASDNIIPFDERWERSASHKA